MKESNHDEVRTLLKKAFPAVNAEPARDLWPAVLRKLSERAAPVSWYDWALAAALAGVFLLFPELIPVLLYHL